MINLKTLAVMILTVMTTHLAFAQSMTIESIDGQTTTIDLNDVESILFENNNMVVNKTSCGDNYFNISYSQNITFDTASTVGINDINSNTNDILIYPNPVSNRLFIETQSNTPNNANIISINGEIVKSFKINDQKSDIDISNLPSGMYFLTIENHQTTKFIKK